MVLCMLMGIKARHRTKCHGAAINVARHSTLLVFEVHVSLERLRVFVRRQTNGARENADVTPNSVSRLHGANVLVLSRQLQHTIPASTYTPRNRALFTLT